MSRKRDALQSFVCKSDKEAFCRLYESVMKCKCISNGAKFLFGCMQIESRGKEHFFFPASAQDSFDMSHASFSRWKKELIDNGFITERKGDVYDRKTLYSFSKDWQNINRKS